MHKVVIERPRWNPGPGKNGRRANLPDELLPKFEGIKRSHRHRKGLTDLLGPLKRWLQAQVGRPWNDVYSEACAVIKPDSIIRAHVKTHLLQFVERHTFIRDGRVCVLDTGYRGRGIVPVEDRRYGWNMFFVHPETGLLQAIPQFSRRARQVREPKPPLTIPWLRENVALQQLHGLWFECHFEVVPVDVKFKAYDHALERVVSRRELTRHDTQYFLCTLKRQLSKRELRRFGLRNAPILHSIEAQPSAGRTCNWLTTVLQSSRRSFKKVLPALRPLRRLPAQELPASKTRLPRVNRGTETNNLNQASSRFGNSPERFCASAGSIAVRFRQSANDRLKVMRGIQIPP